MAKTLHRPMPTSSVANLLEAGVGAQAMARPATHERMTTLSLTPVATVESARFATSQVQSTGEVPEIPRQFTLTASTDKTLKRMVDIFADNTGLELRHSELLRAILHAAAAALPELHEEARQIGPLRRPKNERGREAQREAVERRIARAFAAALRAAPAES